ncbi:MAG: iron ABC transporter permease [Chloroflexi bacterium]|nr:iron ABC transporter permease [Chloroflexota bacterium]
MALVLVALWLSTAVGAVTLPLREILAGLLPVPLRGGVELSSTTYAILYQIRLPRTVLVALVGAALAGSGAAYQGLFRNPLADPYLLGVASGGGLGAVIAMTWQTQGGPDYARDVPLPSLVLIPLAAFAGALLTVVLVYRLGSVRGTSLRLMDSHTSRLILAGVAIGAFATAMTTFVMLRLQGDMYRPVAWMLGGFTIGGWGPVLASLPFILIGLGALAALGRVLNVMQFGEDQAQHMGLNVTRARAAIIVSASMATAAAVAFSGIIGFVGLAVPHAVRLMWTHDYRKLVPLSILLGAGGLLLADVLARTLVAPQEIPLGVVTAALGAPFFLYQLRRAGLE